MPMAPSVKRAESAAAGKASSAKGPSRAPSKPASIRKHEEDGVLYLSMSSVFTTEQARHNEYVPAEIKVRVHPETLSESTEESSMSPQSVFGHEAQSGSAEKAPGEAEPPANEEKKKKKKRSGLEKFKRACIKSYYIAQAYYPMFQPYVAEFVGTFLFVFLGTGCVAAIVLIGAIKGILEMGIVWGISLAISIYATASISGAHLNPAISVTMALFSKRTGFSWKRCALYVLAQFLGGFLSGAVNLSIWREFITEFEAKNGITRGWPGSERSAMVLTDFFPNPGFFPQYFPLSNGTSEQSSTTIIATTPPIFSTWLAFSVETFGTGILSFLAFAVTDPGNKAIHRKEIAPMMIGLTLTLLICLFAPLTQACFNPARDFGPRLVAALAGWREIAMAPKKFWVYLVGPFLGGPLGAFVYLFGLERRLDGDEEEGTLID
ncbi:hypothetical protein HDU96_010583 [Phlyctochytrium bullatum]|nr:hypothetical protein HDU96_010583 [Phlyctochytrium bullatum]